MSDAEAKIEAVLSRLEDDIAAVGTELDALLAPASIDSLSAAKPDEEKATPYAISAYALSSLLFAYLRSEGQDTALVMPELARVRDKMEKLSKPRPSEDKKKRKDDRKDKDRKDKDKDRKDKDRKDRDRKDKDGKKSDRVSKHTRFDDKKAKKAKK